MDNVIELKLQAIEEEYERPTMERVGKVLVAALVGLLASIAAESLYDYYTVERRKKKTETQDTDS